MDDGMRKTILLVEDEAIIAMYESKQLEAYGYKTIHAMKGHEAIRLVFDSTFGIDLVLMDIDLGEEKDGTEIAAEILTRIEIPIVFLSSHTEPKVVEKTEKITSYGYVVKNTDITVLDASIKMAFKLFEIKNADRKKEEALKISEEKYRALADTSPYGIQMTDVDGTITFGNPALHRVLECSDGELVGKRMWDVTVDAAGKRRLKRYHEKLVAERPGLATYYDTIQTHAGSSVAAQINWSFIDSPDNRSQNIIGVFTDVTDLKRAESELNEKNARLTAAQEIAKLGWWEYDIATNAVTWSAEMFQIYGISEDEGPFPFERLMELVHPDYRSYHGNQVEVLLRDGEADFEYPVLRPDGTLRWVHAKGKLSYDDDGNPVKMFGMLQNIHVRKTAEERIQSLLNEKELILKEVHHRVKNNMASIENLLSLQLESLTDPASISVLTKALGRVAGMRILYDKILVSDAYQAVSLRDYLGELVESLVTLFDDSSNVTLDMRGDDVAIASKKVFPLGIIINELVTNAMKHAPAADRRGAIVITVTSEHARVTVTVHDNGPGLPAGFDIDTSRGLGLLLVGMLSRQIEGVFALENEGGAKATIEFNR